MEPEPLPIPASRIESRLSNTAIDTKEFSFSPMLHTLINNLLHFVHMSTDSFAHIFLHAPSFFLSSLTVASSFPDFVLRNNCCPELFVSAPDLSKNVRKKVNN